MSDAPGEATTEGLWDAARTSASDLDRLLEEGTWSDEELSKALWLAAQWNQPKALESLLQHGAQDTNRHALGLSVKSLESLKLLLTAHKIDAKTANAGGHLLLHKVLGSGSEEVLRYFIENGVDLNLSYKGLTALHICAFHGWVSSTQALVEAGALTDIEATTSSYRATVGETPTMVAKRQIRVQGAANMDVAPWEEIERLLA